MLLFIVVQANAQRGDWYHDEGGYVFEGLGTKEEPYLISSVSGLTYLAQQVNMTPGETFRGTYFRLTKDLDIGAHHWIAIGCDAAHVFQGIFDGNGKTIRNLYVDNSNSEGYPASGLFGYLGNGAKIENLTIEGGKVSGDSSQSISYTGSFAGYLYGNTMGGEVDSIVIRNCHNRNVTVIGGASDYANTGGLIGEGYAFSDSDGMVYILIEHCTNNGNIIAAASNYPYTGGIIGKGRGHGYCDGSASSTGSFIIKSCKNYGVVTGGDTRGDDAVTATGGIVGFGYATGDGYGFSEGSGSFTLYLCLNSGQVNGGNAASRQSLCYTGGIFGYGDGYGYGDKSSMSENINDGNGYGSGKFTVTSCANIGVISGGDALSDGAITSTGGIFGYASGSASGDDQGEGYGYGAFSLRNCYSYTDISAPKGFVGGLGGWINTTGNGPNHTISAIIQDSFAAGSVNKKLSSSFIGITGGIVGQVHKSEDTSTNPRIDRCVAVLSSLYGDEGRTYRIAGEFLNVALSTRVLSRNYAYVAEGNWADMKTIRNGNDWSGIMSAPPLDEWNSSERAWQFPRSNNVMPRLWGITGQTNVPAIPYE